MYFEYIFRETFISHTFIMMSVMLLCHIKSDAELKFSQEMQHKDEFEIDQNDIKRDIIVCTRALN